MTKLLQALDRVLDGITILLLIVLLLVVGAQILTRYVLNYSLFWSEELARYLFIYLVFIGSAIVLRRNGHIQVSVFVERLPFGVRRGLAIVSDLLLLSFTVIVLIHGVRLAAMVWTVPTAAMLIPWTLVYLGIVLGMAAMVLAVLGSLLSQFLDRSPLGVP
jgi:TRAP-type C4-dicarboxylate transport system permease small subunit